MIINEERSIIEQLKKALRALEKEAPPFSLGATLAEQVQQAVERAEKHLNGEASAAEVKHWEEKPSVAEALRLEMMKLVEGTLTEEVLLRIMRVAKTGRELLMSLAVSPGNLANMVKRTNGFLDSSFLGGSDGGLGLMDTPVVGTMSAIPYATASPNENFGMTALREIIAAVKNQNGTSPVKLVEALAIARENKLDDVAKDLERQLGMGKEKETPKPEEAKTS